MVLAPTAGVNVLQRGRTYTAANLTGANIPTGSTGLMQVAQYMASRGVPVMTHRIYIPQASQQLALAEPTTPVTGRERSVGELMGDQLDQRSETCLRRGWEQFRAGDYLSAAGTFGIADAIGRKRTLARVGRLWANFAAGQYAEAAQTLRWLIENDPEMFTRPFDPRRYYQGPTTNEARGGATDTLDEQLHALALYLTADPADTGARAVYAYVCWFAGDRATARAEAATIARLLPKSPFAKLADRMPRESR